MEKVITFVTSTSLIRGRKLAPKAGFFCFSASGFFSQISSGPSLSSAKKRTARESGLVDSDIWRVAFLFAKKCQQVHYVHTQTSFVRPGAKLPIEASTSNPIKRPPHYPPNKGDQIPDERVKFPQTNF